MANGIGEEGGTRKKVLVYGAGVLGSITASLLADSPHEVKLLARGKRLEELREHGIHLENGITGATRTAQVDLVESLEPDDVYDLVLVVMQRSQVPSVLPTLAANRHVPTVAFLGNNVTGAEEMAEVIGAERVLLGFVGAGGYREGHKICHALGEPGEMKVVLGEPDRRRTTRLEEVAAILASAGIQPDLPSDVDAWLKTHAVLVLPLGGALYAVDGDIKTLAGRPDLITASIDGLREGLRVLRALRIPILPWQLRLTPILPNALLRLKVKRTLTSRLGEVALAGHAAVARPEMAQLCRQLRVLIEQSGVATPTLDHLFDIIEA
ncbi:MAG: ketopantoate reductase family protein [Deltaproteobacteria bacterium]|nr:ketopantoate reductase family protein [Deltaproteobacteria bacterium]